MIRYHEFEDSVRASAPEFEHWRHLLPAIPIAFRRRFLRVLNEEFSLPDSFDIIISSQNLLDDKFEEFVVQAKHSHVFLHERD